MTDRGEFGRLNKHQPLIEQKKKLAPKKKKKYLIAFTVWKQKKYLFIFQQGALYFSKPQDS